MTRFLFLLLALLLLASPGLAQADVALRPNVTVAGDVIRLGDIFTGVGRHADETVAPAPPLGIRTTYSSLWLRAVARAHNLDWRPSSDFAHFTVQRASRTIGSGTITRDVLKAMSSIIAGKDVKFRFDNPNVSLLVPAKASDTITVSDLTFHRRTGRFSAYVSAPADAPNARRQLVTGSLIFEVEVPVLNRAVPRSTVLTRKDIEEIKMPRNQIGPNVITDPSQLIGKSARHALSAGLPLQASDVQDPVLVHKGDLVMIELRTSMMELTAQGKALEDGSMGSVIAVTNTQSKRSVEATVAGPNVVRVGAIGEAAPY